MRRVIRGLLGGLVVLLLVGQWATPATAAPYQAICTAQGEPRPYRGSVQGVAAWFMNGNTFYRGNYCQIGKAHLVMQSDGNLVVYDEFGAARWATSLFNSGVFNRGTRATFQGFDGNFVEYDSANTPLWASGTCCRLGAKLAVQADGNVVVYDNAWRPLWHTATYH